MSTLNLILEHIQRREIPMHFLQNEKKNINIFYFYFLTHYFQAKLIRSTGFGGRGLFFHIYKQILFLNSLSLIFRQYEHSPSF